MTTDNTQSDEHADEEPAMGDESSDDRPSENDRSAISDELGVPEHPPDPEETPHVLPDELLRYPEFSFEEGSMSSDGSFDLERSLDRDGIREWLEELDGGLASHDIGVSTDGEVALFGVGSGDVSVSFEPDQSHRGRLEFTFSLDAKLMTFSDDPSERVAGARGGKGFIPIEMLTSDRDPEKYRCYNWIDDPLERE